ncbi:MAG: 6-phosphofructokinase [Clostridia bacterium]|nr:6-phosphofructokinase [Clostridia bacterium]
MSESNKKEIRRIGVLTSGGDAPGMNAALRGVVRAGLYRKLQVFGIQRGYEGLLEGEISEMNAHSVSNIISRGGTVLLTARSKEFATPEGVRRGKAMAEIFKLDALVVIGGDGSFRGARDLHRAGMPVIGIPATIDNDVGCTDYTIGYDTAMNTVKEAIDRIKDTAYSHERCSVVEVMGRNAGYIALNCGIAGGAEACIIPEKDFDINEDIIKPILACRNAGKHHYIIIVAEGVGGSMEIAQQIKEITGITTNATILGHQQRGGSPTVRDRVAASLMGAKAVSLLAQGITGRVIAMKGESVVDLDIEEALEMKKDIDEHLIETSKILSLY